jgi:hypothetical protein
MKLVWNSTGDWLDIDPINYKLVQYWINSLDRDNCNVFHLEKNYFDLNWPSSLNEHICAIDDFLTNKLNIDRLSVVRNQDTIDQHVLNDIHRVWIRIICDYPKLVSLISHNETLYHHWNQINKKVHAIEEGFKSVYIAEQYWETPNIFGPDILNFDFCQIQVIFSQEGRSTFNKWNMFDYNIDDRDTNNFLNIGSEVSITLNRSCSYSPPKEYVDFCNSQGIPVIGRTLNLANFSKFESDLCNIRHVYLRNIAHENNTASFRL